MLNLELYQKNHTNDIIGKGNGEVTEVVFAKEATDAELMAMMQGMIKQRNDSIKMYIDGNRPELAEKEKAEIAIIESFLPKQMTEAEIETVIKDIIAEVGASSMKDMGKIMGVLKAKYTGQLDMGKANGIIKASLTGN